MYKFEVAGINTNEVSVGWVVLVRNNIINYN
jgi:hypothetical protein